MISEKDTGWIKRMCWNWSMVVVLLMCSASVMVEQSVVGPMVSPTASPTVTATPTMNPYDDEQGVGSPIAALFLLLLVLFVFFIIIIGIVIVVVMTIMTLVGIAIMAMGVSILIVAGIITTSTLVGFLQRRLGSAITAFFLQLGGGVGILCGVGSAWFMYLWFNLQLSFWLVTLGGGLCGLVSGGIIGLLFSRIFSQLYGWGLNS